MASQLKRLGKGRLILALASPESQDLRNGKPLPKDRGAARGP